MRLEPGSGGSGHVETKFQLHRKPKNSAPNQRSFPGKALNNYLDLLLWFTIYTYLAEGIRIYSVYTVYIQYRCIYIYSTSIPTEIGVKPLIQRGSAARPAQSASPRVLLLAHTSSKPTAWNLLPAPNKSVVLSYATKHESWPCRRRMSGRVGVLLVWCARWRVDSLPKWSSGMWVSLWWTECAEGLLSWPLIARCTHLLHR